MNDISKARAIAHRAHAGQVDKAGVQYIRHPEAVASKVCSAQGKVVAWLHDVLEDSEVTGSALRDVFPPEIVDAVVALTRAPDEAYEDYLRRVACNALAVEVKLADIEHNSDITRIQEPTKKDLARVERYQIYKEQLLGETHGSRK